jgi:hypothetical protein
MKKNPMKMSILPIQKVCQFVREHCFRHVPPPILSRMLPSVPLAVCLLHLQRVIILPTNPTRMSMTTTKKSMMITKRRKKSVPADGAIKVVSHGAACYWV